MSERMIELQRAKLLGQTPPPVASPSVQSQSSTQSSRPGSQPQQANNTEYRTPEEAAVAQVLSEDAQMQRFIHRLQRRNDSHPIADSISGPTVPTALSRRMLHRQGVGYLDDTVAAVISASADRFLATVLQQGIACQDQRLTGSRMAKEAARHRKRHMQHYEADTDDRKRRKDEAENNREEQHRKAIAAAEALKKGGKGEDRKKKKAKKAAEDKTKTQPNGVTNQTANIDDGDDESYDSIDEEEEYYQKRCEPLEDSKGKLNDDEDEDDALMLRDLVRPLEAWKFNITGKQALEPSQPESEDESGDEEDDENLEGAVAQQPEENGNDESILFASMVDGADTKGKGDDTENNKRKRSSSPVPPSASS